MVILFLFTLSRMYYTFTAMNVQYLLYALVLDVTFFCLLMGIILVQHLIQFKNGYKNDKG